MKKIFFLLLMLLLIAGFYAMTVNAKGNGGALDLPPAVTASLSPSAVPPTCKVHTGIDGGTVNLRSCAGTSCAVLDILTEGESLDIITTGKWINAMTADGFTGWLNSKYCEVKR
jgi:uncharacterized protein YgiM (DUF1202 family)